MPRKTMSLLQVLQKLSAPKCCYRRSSSSSVTSQALIDLLRPPLIVSAKVFQFVFAHLVYNSALFWHSVLLILVTYHSHFDLYILSFSSTGSTFKPSKTTSLFLWAKREYTALLLKIFISTDANVFNLVVYGSKFRFHIKEWEEPVHYILLFLNISGPKSRI